MPGIDWDDAYANGKYIEGAADYPARWQAQAAAFRRELLAENRCRLDIAYGSQPREVLDLFLPAAAPKGLVVFVHGGYWLAFDKSTWSHLAQGALAREYAVAIPSYTLCPEASISAITAQIAAAIDTAAGRIAGPIHLVGHSAGGHLVTRMLCSDITWGSCFPARVAKVVSISGLHDLRPLLLTEMNARLGLDVALAAAESPMLCPTPMPVPVTAWVGTEERPVFVQQSRWLAEAWDNAEVVLAAKKHHFNVIEDLAEPESPLTGSLLG